MGIMATVSSSTRYFIVSVECSEKEIQIIQQVLTLFPEAKGAVVYDGSKARYCLDLAVLDSEKSKELIEQIHTTIEFAISRSRK